MLKIAVHLGSGPKCSIFKKSAKRYNWGLTPSVPFWNSPKLSFDASQPLLGANCHKAKKIPLTRASFLSPCSRWYKRAYPNGSMKTKKPEIQGFRVFCFVIPLGFEPKTHSLEGCCSIQLSYGTIVKAGAKLAY